MAQEYILKTQGLRDVIQNMKENFPDGIWMANVSKIEYQKKPQLHQNEKLLLFQKKKKKMKRQTSGKENVKVWKC